MSAQPGVKSWQRNLRDGRNTFGDLRRCDYPPLLASGTEPTNPMCGRYRLTAKERYLRDHFGLEEDPTWTPRWNIAPTQLVPIVRRKTPSSRRSFNLVRWGLIPSWAKDRSIATKTMNAMSETAADKPAFRDSLRLRRCLIPADSFYEWQSNGSKHKQPFSIGMADDSTFAIAGLWESWTDPAGDVVETCTILTTAANALVVDVHNRMPVILPVEDYAGWLDPSINNPSLIGAFFKPYDPARMKKYPVSTRVNRPENDDHDCAQETSIVVTPTLF
jgi:putative SOS response-associated peptidase YedK